jgi:hypothetical protein
MVSFAKSEKHVLHPRDVDSEVMKSSCQVGLFVLASQNLYSTVPRHRDDAAYKIF